MRQALRNLLIRAISALKPKPNLAQENKELRQVLNVLAVENLARQSRADAIADASELLEARRMAGAGPWRTGPEVFEETDRLLKVATESLSNQEPLTVKESSVVSGGLDLDLMLSNMGWRRETNASWLEFSRWGIQQIILISRLYYTKNPLIQRGINIAAQYVFGRGVEVSSPDETANGVLDEFFERNSNVLGQIALTDLERRKYYDGNLFFVFFPDRIDSGKTSVRTIDATEIQEIICDPEDSDAPHFYKRVWTEQRFDEKNGTTATQTRTLWYPALGYEQTKAPGKIGGVDVQWNSPIHHRKCGAVAKWSFGCPLVYAALEWSKASVRFLANCATVKESLAQISILISTKGGQQALQGLKAQLGTNAGPGQGWDTNPPAGTTSVFASGPGTSIEAFNTKGAGGDPEEVRQFKLMVCMVFGLPETFFADVQTGNLATATSLDRPTELNFLEKQEAWREDLLIIAKYVLGVSGGASSGRLREAGSGIEIREAVRVWTGGVRGRWIMEATKVPVKGIVEVLVNFPAIVEADVAQLVAATVAADSTGKLDDKAVAQQLYDLLPDVRDGLEIAEEQYPGTVADRQKAKDDAAAALAAAPTTGFGKSTVKPTEAVKLARRLVEAVSQERNGDSQPTSVR